MDRIASFTVDHTVLLPGLYRSRTDGDIVTYDLRFVRPNSSRLLTNAQLHSTEHLIATLLRNSRCRDAIVYFGPMGCQTGFYLLVDSRLMDDNTVFDLLQEVFQQASVYAGPMPGASEKECGNYRNLSLAQAQSVCGEYMNVLARLTPADMVYPPSARL